MKDTKIEYHPNKQLKHRIVYHPNGRKYREQYYGLDGKYHRDNSCLPDYHSWYPTGITYHKTYCTHGNYHNICNPADIWFFQNGKIRGKYYNINGKLFDNKLTWMNLIKNI
jgi:hypothetical protein